MGFLFKKKGDPNPVVYTQVSRSHKEFFYLGVKAWNIIPQTLRASESIKKFTNTYKSLLLTTILNDDSYQIDNSYDNFYPINN